MTSSTLSRLNHPLVRLWHISNQHISKQYHDQQRKNHKRPIINPVIIVYFFQKVTKYEYSEMFCQQYLVLKFGLFPAYQILFKVQKILYSKKHHNDQKQTW